MIIERPFIAPFKGSVGQEIPDDIYDFLSSKEFLDLICTQEVGKWVEGEEESIKTLALIAFGGRLAKNAAATSGNLIVNSVSGSGKDWVVDHVLSLLPRDSYVRRTRISPTAFTYWHNSKFEPEWTWDGKVVFLEDISENLLNCDVLKVLASGGSHSTVVINQQACDIEIKGKPILIATTAKAIPKPELIRRFPMLLLNESAAQTKAVLKKQANFAKKGKVPEKNPKVAEAMFYLQPVSVKVPFAEAIAEKMQSDCVIMRTSFPRFLDYVKFSAALFQFQREVDTEGYILANNADYANAALAIKKTASTGMIPLTRDQRQILAVFTEPTDDGKLNLQRFSASDIQCKVPFEYRWVLDQLNRLTEYGILEKTSEHRGTADKRTMVFSLRSEMALTLPSWEEIGGDHNG